ncbi:hypothetical protein U0N78_10405 [Streptococcus suis]|uniref:hypothetical protein n=1 Tax=Streptococcus suis TaxID=1307 RepID=UPI0021199239|nr:hypothetical protein [Streptococcus suis]MCQ8786367.1 hypothetical protein [Streptococcus suis]WQE85386.1 hypothetical protein U0N78_10405 [Streptococcus suis]
MNELKPKKQGELIVSEDCFDLIQEMDTLALPTYQKYEITNPKVLAHVEKIVRPAFNNHLKKAGQANIPKGLFKVDLPIGDLHKIKGETDKYRAFVKGADGKINAHAILTPAQADITKGAKAAAAVSGVMQVGAMVVGQYYMSEINGQLNSIKETLDDVKDFQVREFKGTVRALIINISQISKFSADYVENAELARLKLMECANFRAEVTKLLEQVNLAIEDIIAQKNGLPFEKYEKLIDKLSTNLFYQQTLLKLLEELSKLDLVFSQGVTSEDSSYYVYEYYLNNCNSLGEKIANWHKDKIKFFQIDTKRNRRAQEGAMKVVADVAKELDKNAHVAAGVGFLGGIVGAAAGFGIGKAAGELNKAIRYIDVRKRTVKLISEQEAVFYQSSKQLSTNNYGENVELLLEDGNIYYLLPEGRE